MLFEPKRTFFSLKLPSVFTDGLYCLLFPDPVCPPAARTGHLMKEFSDVYEQQYAVALFNSVRYEIEGGGGTQAQLLHRKVSISYERGLSLLSRQSFTQREQFLEHIYNIYNIFHGTLNIKG